MLYSKANAALARLKEIEEKYKLKRKEQRWKEDADSSISSVSIVPLDSPKESPKRATKPKLDIKLPGTQFEGRTEETKLSSRSEERSTSDKANARPPEDAAEIDLDVAMPLDDKSSRSAGKQESLISDTMTIQESSLIESVLDDTVTSSKSLSGSKTSRRNSSTISDKSFGREERTGTRAARSKAGSESGKSSEISRGKAPTDNSSITKRPKLTRKSNEISRRRLGLKKRSVEDKAVAETPKEAEVRDSKVRGNSNDSGTLRYDSVVEESIGTMENGSEIISELSRAEESFTAKIENSVDVSESTSEHLTVENGSKGPMAENGYANDTFEDISSSTFRSRREEMINGRKEVVDGAGSGARKMDVAEYRSYQDSAEKHRDELLIALDLAPKQSATKVSPESSIHVSDLGSIVANPNNVPVRSTKLPQSASSCLEDRRRRYRHRQESLRDENVSSAASSNKNTSDSSESSTGDVTKTDEKKNSLGMTVRQESGRKEREVASNGARERAMIDVTGQMPVANDEDWIESAKSNSSLEETEQGKDVSEESLDQQDVKYALRKPRKGASAKRHASSKTTTKASRSSFDSDSTSMSEVRNTSETRKVSAREENETRRSLEKNKVSNHNCRKDNLKRRKKRARTTNSKSAGTPCNRAESRKEDKTSRFDRDQTRRLRKRIVELRLRQEREDLQKYLHELKDLRLESGYSTRSYFRPLEFPKIAEFMQPDVNDLESKPDGQFWERVFAIRRWLKDQYILYRDYCTMAQAINAHYVPTTLDDAKKTIRELRKTTITTR